jgi:hypothetical protein
MSFRGFALFASMIYVKNLELIQVARLVRNHKFNDALVAFDWSNISILKE